VEALTELKTLTERFAGEFAAKRKAWRDRLEQHNGKAIVWSAGTKGVMFLNLLRDDAVSCAVDLNPRKQSKFVPGTGQPIVGPDAVRDIAPDLVIVMNPLYEVEIREALRGMDLDPEVLTV
jgi:hypothetical protein